MDYDELADEARNWEERATEAEKQNCPTCGIAHYWLIRCHPSNREAVSGCSDPFHIVDTPGGGRPLPDLKKVSF